MSNTITIELCTEDRERLDRLIAAMERKACDKCVESALAFVGRYKGPGHEFLDKELHVPKEDPREAPKNAQDGAEAETPTTAHQEAEPATVAEPAPAPKAETPTASVTDVQQLVIGLSTSGKKPETRDIIQQYAERVTLIPADKLGEVYAKLVELAKQSGLAKKLGLEG